MTNLIIPLFKGPFEQNKQETLAMLNRHMMKVMDEFICEINKVHEFLVNLRAQFGGHHNCSYKSDFVRCESYLQEILPGLENTRRFAEKFKEAVQKGLVEFADDDIRVFHTLNTAVKSMLKVLKWS
ncbi:uncharacterized protein LOC132751428 [Ruditapes philippinarum]|uniref:uncharacterized protein LOC132751428 n=1 Tax=Ruditapes philippinarum TaxID=129788 RepID=UPI00295B65B8|nr:uncharacterized protein LOC132751428 [Ruditapes philippinarum]